MNTPAGDRVTSADDVTHSLNSMPEVALPFMKHHNNLSGHGTSHVSYNTTGA